MNGALASIALTVILSGCSMHANPKVDTSVVHRGGYAYQRINDGEYVVAAVDGRSFQEALKELGCTSKYVCEIEREGDIFTVQLHAK